MSRKKASFSQLIDYMNKELSSPHIIGHNLYTDERSSQAEIINEFEKNAEYLPKRKNGNYLYHEVISFEKNEIDTERMDEIIIELAELYLSERAPKQLAYAVIHRDTEKPHIHFCISANELGSDTRKRLTKKKFNEIQKNLEQYAQEKFPELEGKLIYSKARDSEKAKTTSREQELKKRTGKVSQKDLLKNKLHGLFELSNNKKELDEHLEKEGYKVYTRGKNAGIEKTDTGKKHRFKTLGVMEHYLSALERFDSLEKEKRQESRDKEQEAVAQKAAEEQRREEQQQKQAEALAQQEKERQEAEKLAEAQKQKRAELQQQRRAAEEAEKHAEAQRQSELRAQQENALKHSQQQKEEVTAKQHREKQEAEKAVQTAKQRSTTNNMPGQKQRAEYETEKAAEEKRREAFLSRRAGETSQSGKKQSKPTKTERRQRTEQVRREEERNQQKNKQQRPFKPKAKNVQPTKQQRSSRPTHKEDKKPLKDKQNSYIERKAREVEQELEEQHQANPVEKGVKKATDFVSDRAADLKRIITGKNKNKDRER